VRELRWRWQAGNLERIARNHEGAKMTEADDSKAADDAAGNDEELGEDDLSKISGGLGNGANFMPGEAIVVGEAGEAG